ncbi:MAG: GtrA family protein [Thermodesulfobacteriota bacterium]|nr:GtrA family protein [Thermodesulfobacteriota bacterium]
MLRIDIQKISCFAIVGLIGTSAHFGLLFLLVELFKTDVVVASSLGYIVGFSINYFLNYKYTFNCLANHSKVLIKYMFVTVCGFFFNMLFMYLTCKILVLPYFWGQIISTGGVFFINYFFSSSWAFRES